MTATDTATPPAGQVFHMLSDNGLELTSVYDGPEGVASVKIGWKDVEVARNNYCNAADGFVERLPEIMAKMAKDKDSKQRLRRVGRFNVLVGTGKPLWLLPKARIRRKDGLWEFSFGWLYTVIQLFEKGGRS